MVSVPVQCPYCQSTTVIKAGKQANGTQRYRCQNEQCTRRIFLLQYQDCGRIPEIRRQVVDMAINGSGIRDTTRVLRSSPTTVIAVLKKAAALKHYPERDRSGDTQARAGLIRTWQGTRRGPVPRQVLGGGTATPVYQWSA
jgi:transposase-like protein